jgi:catechol 2,3-dioxygenase-like lactoylglutathione lyase family enzyme
MEGYKFHHVAISVADVDRSIAFYDFFGFKPVLRWQASDGSVVIVHLLHPSGFQLEIVYYSVNDGVTVRPGVGNDLQQVGVKHFALHVDSGLSELRDTIIARQLGEVTEITFGRTRFDLFFVRDPDGYWMELLTDNRSLDIEDPVLIEEAPRLLPGE